MFDGLAINPAYSGSRGVLSITGSYRDQWAGFPGAPVTQTFSIHAPLKKRSIGLGLLLSKDEIGITEKYSVYGNYAFRFRIGKGWFSLGIRGGLNIIQYEWGKIETSVPNDITFPNITHSYNLPNFGTGFYYQSDKFYIGASIPFLLSYHEKSSENGYEMYHDISNYNILGTAGFVLNISENFKIKPSGLLKYHKNTPLQFDLNAFCLFKDLWIGASYRIDDVITPMIKFPFLDWLEIGKLEIGIAYDFSLSEINEFNKTGALEILFRYELIFKIRAVNPRYF